MDRTAASERLQRELEALRQRVAVLETREAQFRALLETTPQAVLIHTERPLYCNAAAAALFGYESPQELLALPSVEVLVAPEVRATQVERCRQRLAGQSVPPVYELEALRKDGTRLWLRVAAQRVAWGEGEAVHCIYTDISARKRAEDELRTFRRIMHDAMDALPLWVAVKDLQGHFLLANEALAGAYGKHSADLEGLTAIEVGTRDARMLKKVVAIDSKVLEQGATVVLENYLVIMPDGSEQIRHLIKTPLRDEAQRIIGLVGVSSDVTAQRRAAEELRASQRLMQTVVDSLPLWLMVKDREGRCALANRAMAEAFGATPEALVGSTVDKVGPREPEERALVSRTDGAVIETAQPIHEPAVSYTLPDGTRQLRDLYKYPLFGDDGGVQGLVAVSLDVTQRVEAQRQHEADWRLLQNVVDTIPHFVFVKDRQSRYLLVNRAMADAFGVAPEALLGRPPQVLEVATAEERAQFVAKDAEVWVAEQRVDDPEFRVTLPGGRVRILHSVKVPLRDQSGAVVGLVGVAEDITERQTAENALQAQRRLLQAVFDAIPAWVFVKDRDGRFLMVNDTLARDAGLSPDAFQGLPHDAAPQGNAEERAHIRASDKRLLADGVAQDRTEELTLPDGRLTLRHTHKVPLRDEDGAIVGIVGLSEDITEQRAMEEQLRRMQRMEAIGTLAGGIAHDFNNILFPIIGFTELTMRELDPGSGAHHNLSIVRDAAFRAKDIVSQILTFSRRSDNKPEVMQLRPLVRESLRFLRSTLPRTVQVEEHIERDVAHVHADAVQMHQVLMNLCVNAAHAMHEGGKLSVSLHEVVLEDFHGYTGGPVSGRHVCLSVADTGAGIDPEVLPRIFEPFYTTKPVGQGTGLGLSTVLGIVTQHHGLVDVHTAPGEGCCFDVYLPAVPAPGAEAPLQDDAQGLRGDAAILFVDDEWAVTELATHVLEEQGYRVSSFTSSRAALRAFQADPERFDLVITDQMMPDLTGDKLAQAIRRVRADIPILLGTGFSEVITPEGAQAMGIDEVYYKPVTPDRLTALVRRALLRRDDDAGRGGVSPPA